LREPEVSEENLKNLETVTVLRILYNLGYFKKNFNEYFNKDTISNDFLKSFSLKRKMAVLDINEALKETHL
jgi:hypothetical protein